MSWNFPVGPRVHTALLMGHVAVDVFFIILSGFILTLVYRDLMDPGMAPSRGGGSAASIRCISA